MIDSYKLFIDKFGIKDDDLIDFGLSNIISIDLNTACKEWEGQKDNIQHGGEVYVRTFGNKNDERTKNILLNFYQNIYPNLSVRLDSNGNQNPTKLIQKLTNNKKKKDIVNFQVSHIFGQTKNIYAFTAPWNIVFMPKIMDPLTGHEAHGNLKNRFKNKLQNIIYKKYEDLILDFNSLMSDSNLKSSIDTYLSLIDEPNFKKGIKIDFSEIKIDSI